MGDSMMKRQVFFSFHYQKDVWRAAQVKNMGIVDDSSTWSSNDWEQVRRKSDIAISSWIDDEMAMRSCVVVLIGNETYSRKWVKYEIEKAYELGKGIVGVYIDKLRDQNRMQTQRGKNPFDCIYAKGKPLSYYVDCFVPGSNNSEQVYSEIKEQLPRYIERAIEKAGKY